MKIGILTCSAFPGLSPRDRHLIPLFKDKGVQLDILIWNDAHINWKEYHGLLFRSVWDYHLHNADFNNWLDNIEQQGVKTLNPVQVIRQNQHKFYLKELQSKGVEIVPTIFIEKTDRFELSNLRRLRWPKAVIKPAISGGGYLTTLFLAEDLEKVEKEYQPVAKERDLLLQPFIPEVIEGGEVSLIFFNRKYSHAVIKRAQPGDFRVQAAFGGEHEAFEPGKKIMEAAENILSLINGALLYARVDGLIQKGRFVLMELELLEPDLYFDVEPKASSRYVDAAIDMFSK